MTAVVEATVVAVEELSPSFLRIRFAGCEEIETGGYDQRIKILLPGAGTPLVLPPADDWYAAWCAMDPSARPIMRTFTIRSQQDTTLDIEFALHGDAGPASAWARTARPGSKLGIIGPTRNDTPKALAYHPGDHDWHLFIGDDTAVPAIASILETLSPHSHSHIFLQVPHPGDVRNLTCPGTTHVTWTIGTGLLPTVRAAELPDSGRPYAWVAGEATLVRSMRQHLLDERGWDRKTHYFGGYWKSGQPTG